MIFINTRILNLLNMYTHTYHIYIYALDVTCIYTPYSNEQTGKKTVPIHIEIYYQVIMRLGVNWHKEPNQLRLQFTVPMK